MQGVGKLSSSRNDRSVTRDESIMDIKCFKLVLMHLLSPQPPSHIVILMVKVLFFVGD